MTREMLIMIYLAHPHYCTVPLLLLLLTHDATTDRTESCSLAHASHTLAAAFLTDCDCSFPSSGSCRPSCVMQL